MTTDRRTDFSPEAIAKLGRTNARNKITIQRDRAKDARLKATLEGLTHYNRFPTRYKYG